MTPTDYAKAVVSRAGLQERIESCEDERERKPLLAQLRIVQSRIDLMDLELEDTDDLDSIVVEKDLHPSAIHHKGLAAEINAKIVDAEDKAEAMTKRLEQIETELEELSDELDAELYEAEGYDGRLSDSDDSLSGYMLNPELGEINPFKDKTKEREVLQLFIEYPNRIFKSDLKTHPADVPPGKVRRFHADSVFENLLNRGMLVQVDLPQDRADQIIEERAAKARAEAESEKDG